MKPIGRNVEGSGTGTALKKSPEADVYVHPGGNSRKASAVRPKSALESGNPIPALAVTFKDSVTNIGVCGPVSVIPALTTKELGP